jgi:cytochrome c oxidase subunit 2
MGKAEKLALTLSGLLLMVFFSAIIYASAARGIVIPTCITDVEPFTQGSIIDMGENRYEIQMVARMWAFDVGTGRNVITLPAGSEVDLYVVSQDIVHGFHIEKTNLNLMAVPGAINYARVKFDEPGEYFFACHEFCGAAHHTMAGRFVITEHAQTAGAQQ